MRLTDEARRDMGLPADCGIYDPIRNRWSIRDSELRRYRPDLLPTEPDQIDDDDGWSDEDS